MESDAVTKLEKRIEDLEKRMMFRLDELEKLVMFRIMLVALGALAAALVACVALAV